MSPEGEVRQEDEMAFVEHSGDQVSSTLRLILELSWRISGHSPPMKPFVRFSKQTDEVYRHRGAEARRLLWDFDDTLQRVLLRIAKAVATPEQLAHSCVERWKVNLEQLYSRKRRELDTLIESGESFQPQYTTRDEFLFARTEPGGRFLYVGCGSGTECLRLASGGYEVVGIDTVFKLTRVANEWSGHLDLPFEAICMDVMDLGFAQRSFDGFLLEFYGHQPVFSRSLALQRNLAHTLRDGGKGFIVGSRKKYASFWYKMGSRYSASMTRWLTRQSRLDYYWSESDGCEEQLSYGLYWRSHTVDSLGTELSRTFDIVECMYEEYDPRYVVCVVERKEDSRALEEVGPGCGELIEGHLDVGTAPAEDALSLVESICDLLESHERKVVQFFDGDLAEGQSPLRGVQANLSEFMDLLWEVCEE
jgi:SAM-dependent methyltransferase